MNKEKTLSFYYGIGQRIQKKREELGLNQKELADKINVSFRTIQNYESNLVNPKIEILKSMVEIFNCDLEYLLFGKSERIVKKEEFLYFQSMYKNLEELEEVNDLISNFNHKLDNIENSKLRKKLIESFTNLIKQNINLIESSINENSSKNLELSNIDLEEVQIQISLTEQEISQLSKKIKKDYAMLNKLHKIYFDLLEKSKINED